MQALAAWLVAKPRHGIVALAVTILPTFLMYLSGAVLALLILKKGLRAGLSYAAIALLVASAVTLVTGLPLTLYLRDVAMIWLPAMIFAISLLRTRSLVLTLQLGVVFAVAGIAIFYAAVGDAAQFWQATGEDYIARLREIGQHESADFVVEALPILLDAMTALVALYLLTLHAVGGVLGYKQLRQLPGETARYGLFRDLNYGRVIAVVLAAASVAAYLSDSVWLQNVAFVMFFAFWLQGLAVLHWLHAAGYLPAFGIVTVYVLMPFLSVILMMSLALVGYIDAWFRLRRPRIETE